MLDIGVNLTNRAFRSDREAVLERAAAAGVRGIVLTGTSVEGSREAADLVAALRPTAPVELWSTAGVHPHDAKSCDDTTLDALRELAARPEVVALGECGLDFNRNYSPPDVQLVWFERQLELAAELSLPLFLHQRDAHDAFLELMRAHRDRLGRAVVHCFTGTESEVRAYLDLDLHVGFTGWICDERRGLDVLDLVPLVPPDRLMIETDAPYLLPRTLRPRPKPRRNEPAYLTEVRDAVARVTGRDATEVGEQTEAVARTFFGV